MAPPWHSGHDYEWRWPVLSPGSAELVYEPTGHPGGILKRGNVKSHHEHGDTPPLEPPPSKRWKTSSSRAFESNTYDPASPSQDTPMGPLDKQFPQTALNDTQRQELLDLLRLKQMKRARATVREMVDFPVPAMPLSQKMVGGYRGCCSDLRHSERKFYLTY